MSTQLETVTVKGKTEVRHYATIVWRVPYPDGIGRKAHLRTLCGLYGDEESRFDVLRSYHAKARYRTCSRCMGARSRRDVDRVIPDADDATRARARQVGPFTEIPARVFRVTGSTDTYTVTIPVDPYLATLCTCMAGKTNPDKQCKHQTAVLNELVERGELIG